MRVTFILVSALVAVASAAINEPCDGLKGIAGVCIDTKQCQNKGGSAIKGQCPGTPDNIRCCSKPKCPNGASGNCRWQSDCAGGSKSGQCPGPAQFKCCSSGAQGSGGYKEPKIPSVGACRQVAVSGAKKVIRQFPGRIREIGCVRDCKCGSGSDHCCGKAIDFMLSDHGGDASISGLDIAEWVMNNRGSLNLKYVIWGQRIWNPSSDAVKPWGKWRSMDNRGSITDNHWDHVHASFT